VEKNMNTEQILTALEWMESNYDLAIGHKEYGLAAAFQDKIDWLLAELQRVTFH
jgi:hypothetical protein